MVSRHSAARCDFLGYGGRRIRQLRYAGIGRVGAVETSGGFQGSINLVIETVNTCMYINRLRGLQVTSEGIGNL